MKDKKKGFLSGLFGNSNKGCDCGVTIVEEPEATKPSKDEKKK